MAYLYQCKTCRYVKLSDSLLPETNLESNNTRKRIQPQQSCAACRFELVSSGSSQALAAWAHSLILGLDKPLQGI